MVIYIVENVGGGIGQDPTTEVTQLSIIFRFLVFVFFSSKRVLQLGGDVRERSVRAKLGGQQQS